MNTGIVIIVVFVAIVFVLTFPTGTRGERAYTQAEGPHPLLRPFLALGRWRNARRKRQRRRHLKVHRS